MNGGTITGDLRLRDEAQKCLRPGEKLLWVAQPDYRQFTKLQWPMVLFGIPWTAITAVVSGGFIYGMFFAHNAGSGFPNAMKPLILLFFVPFWAISIFMLGGHKLLAKRQWGKIFYALTSENIIIHNGKSEVRLDHAAAKNVQIDRLKNGLGTVHFLGSTPGSVNLSMGKFNFQLQASATTNSSTNQTLSMQAIQSPDAFVELVQKIIAAKEAQPPAPPQSSEGSS